MPDCPNLQANKAMCNCTYPCAKKGFCCKCIAYHRDRGELPACYFDSATEATYDRSVECYLKSKNR